MKNKTTKEEVDIKIKALQWMFEGLSEFWTVYSTDAQEQFDKKNTKGAYQNLDILTDVAHQLMNSVLEAKGALSKFTPNES